MYEILANAGWLWALLVFAWITWRLWRRRAARRSGGFSVVGTNDQPH